MAPYLVDIFLNARGYYVVGDIGYPGRGSTGCQSPGGVWGLGAAISGKQRLMLQPELERRFDLTFKVHDGILNMFPQGDTREQKNTLA